MGFFIAIGITLIILFLISDQEDNMGKQHICKLETDILGQEESINFAKEVKEMCEVLCMSLNNDCSIKVDISVEKD